MALGQRLTVSEASRALGLSRTTLLAAEEAGLLTPLRTPGGHRRYDPAELRRYATRAGAVAWSDPEPGAGPSASHPSGDAGGRPADPPEGGADPAEATAMAAAVRQAVRPLAQALDAECVGLYLLRAGTPRFAAAFGVPRWLAERLTAAAAPVPVAQAISGGRTCLFDAAESGFPEPRSTGHGVAVALPGAGARVGAFFVVARTALHAADVRVVEAFGEVLALLVQDCRHIVDLERRLERIAALSSAGPGGP